MCMCAGIGEVVGVHIQFTQRVLKQEPHPGILQGLCLIGPGLDPIVCIFQNTPGDSNTQSKLRGSGTHK